MNDERHDPRDWVIPAVLVGIAVIGLFVVGLAFAAAKEQRSDTPPIILDLATYTDCLIDHGADVPRITLGPDGGFAVVVSGSLVAGEVDPEVWIAAGDECSSLAPDLYSGLVGGWLGGWLGGASGELPEDIVSIEGCHVDERASSSHGPRRPGTRRRRA
jgi:hypothetical protein